jgi:hypothetical protein
MKLPSLHSLSAKAIATLRRFPVALLFVLTGVVFSIREIHYPGSQMDVPHWYWNIMMSAYLGMLLQIALTAFAERQQWSKPRTILLLAAGVALTVVYYFFLPDRFMEISTLRLILFALGLHWLIAFIPFTGGGGMNGFWQYNKILFLRILTAELYSGVLYSGLALALLAIEKLFRINVDYKYYLDLWVILAGLFNTWFFLGGFPADYASLEKRTDYPKGLKIFTQYVLLPIITIYLLILYAYMGRILIMAQWPIGWVSNLVLGFSVAGILSLLLIHPVRDEAGNKWIGIFSKFFYFALLPLLILLFFAISRRIRDYGITESRYFVLLLALWLGFIAIYFLASSAKNIKTIPLSLCLIAFLCSFGPWGAFQVSIASQRHRLDKLFEKNNMLVDGKLTRATGKHIPFPDRKKISTTVEYLVSTHGYKVMQPYFSLNLDSAMRYDRFAVGQLDYSYNYSSNQATRILSLMDLEYIGEYQTDTGNNSNTFDMSVREHGEEKEALNIEGYQYMLPNFFIASNDEDKNSIFYLLDKDSVRISLDTTANRLLITGYGDSMVAIGLDTLIRSIRAKGNLHVYNQPPGDLSVTILSGRVRCRLTLSNIDGKMEGDKIGISSLRADLFLGRAAGAAAK